MDEAIKLPVTINEKLYNPPYEEELVEKVGLIKDGVIDISDVIKVLRKAIGPD